MCGRGGRDRGPWQPSSGIATSCMRPLSRALRQTPFSACAPCIPFWPCSSLVLQRLSAENTMYACQPFNTWFYPLRRSHPCWIVDFIKFVMVGGLCEVEGFGVQKFLTVVRAGLLRSVRQSCTQRRPRRTCRHACSGARCRCQSAALCGCRRCCRRARWTAAWRRLRARFRRGTSCPSSPLCGPSRHSSRCFGTPGVGELSGPSVSPPGSLQHCGVPNHGTVLF